MVSASHPTGAENLVYLAKPAAVAAKQSTLDAFTKPKPSASTLSGTTKPKVRPARKAAPASEGPDTDVALTIKASKLAAAKKPIDLGSDSDEAPLKKPKAAPAPKATAKAKAAGKAAAKKAASLDSEDSDASEAPKAKKGSGKKAVSESDE